MPIELKAKAPSYAEYIDTHEVREPGPIVASENIENRESQESHELFASLQNASVGKPDLSVTDYTTITIPAESGVMKCTPKRVFSCSFYPSALKIMPVVADTRGVLAFWDCASGSDGVYVYRPHTSAITELVFSPVDSTKLFMSSYDGSVRMLDAHAEVGSSLRVHLCPWPTLSSPILVPPGF